MKKIGLNSEILRYGYSTCAQSFHSKMANNRASTSHKSFPQKIILWTKSFRKQFKKTKKTTHNTAVLIFFWSTDPYSKRKFFFHYIFSSILLHVICGFDNIPMENSLAVYSLKIKKLKISQNLKKCPYLSR